MKTNFRQFIRMTYPRRSVVPVLLLTVLATGAVIGCGDAKPPELETFPVAGRILINGEPPARAEIRMRPKTPLKDPRKRSVEPYAYVEPDGKFQVSTYRDKDGAPVGEYAVTVVWPIIEFDGGEELVGPDRLMRRFSDPNSPIATIQVLDGSNHIPNIDLQFEQVH